MQKSLSTVEKYSEKYLKCPAVHLPVVIVAEVLSDVGPAVFPPPVQFNPSMPNRGTFAHLSTDYSF